MTRQLLRVTIGIAALLALTGLVVGTVHPPAPAAATSAAALTPTAAELAAAAAGAEGIGCTSTRACTSGQGGAVIVTSRNSCTAGLPVRNRAGRWYVLTAGHCVANARGAVWRQSGAVLGKGTRWEYAGLGTEGRAGSTDIGLIMVTGNARVLKTRSQVLVMSAKGARTQRITGTKDARAGERVCVTGGRSGTTRCGTVVTATTSLTYPSPGLAARNVKNLALVKGICVRPGDSGSPVFAGRAAVGIAVARSSSGCYMWYSKIPAQLRHFGLRVA